MQQWIKYFLVGVEKTAGEAVRKLSQLLQLKEALEKEIKERFGKRSNNALAMLHALFTHPVLNVEKAASLCNCSFKTANIVVSEFEKMKWLREITGQSRNRLFEFEPYIKIFGK
jgi:Fic family protein